jgi:mannonate dehydratase
MAKIQDIRVIRARPGGSWVIVKILTDQPGLWGIGSANDVHHGATVTTAIEQVIGPRLLGRDPAQIEDIWQSVYTAAYWRNGSILNTALGGIDMALWDIKGKEAGLPLYQLLGGKCRDAVPCYGHASGRDLEALVDDVQRWLEEGFPVVRCQLGAYGGGGFLDADSVSRPKTGRRVDSVFDDEAYLENVPRMFEFLRERLGFGAKLTHDVHEHLKPHNAVTLSKLLEPYRLYFLEDVLPPEQIDWFRLIRAQCTTPQAMGELFVNPNEYVPLISERLIDYVRVRVSKAGGITPCRKIAALCEFFGVQTAFQEGGDNDPVNQAAAMHLDLASTSFGIQEENQFSDAERDAFPGAAILEGGYLYPNDDPGLGVDIDEAKATALWRDRDPTGTAEDRRADGSVVRP